jgi:hypothetical protein
VAVVGEIGGAQAPVVALWADPPADFEATAEVAAKLAAAAPAAAASEVDCKRKAGNNPEDEPEPKAHHPVVSSSTRTPAVEPSGGSPSARKRPVVDSDGSDGDSLDGSLPVYFVSTAAEPTALSTTALSAITEPAAAVEPAAAEPAAVEPAALALAAAAAAAAAEPATLSTTALATTAQPATPADEPVTIEHVVNNIYQCIFSGQKQRARDIAGAKKAWGIEHSRKGNLPPHLVIVRWVWGKRGDARAFHLLLTLFTFRRCSQGLPCAAQTFKNSKSMDKVHVMLTSAVDDFKAFVRTVNVTQLSSMVTDEKKPKFDYAHMLRLHAAQRQGCPLTGISVFDPSVLTPSDKVAFERLLNMVTDLVTDGKVPATEKAMLAVRQELVQQGAARAPPAAEPTTVQTA